MSVDQFEEFRSLVLGSDELQVRLRDETDPGRFARLAVEVGAAHGLHFTTDDVRSAMTASRRRWLGRRLV